jgi:uncharacterized membrane protein YfcA
MFEVVVAAGFGAVVGLALGLTGGGGSIFAMPMLIYGLSLPPAQAVPISLVTVGVTAMVGGIHSIRARLVVWQPTVMFAAGGIIGTPLGLAAARFIAPRWLVAGFAVIALTVGLVMWIRVRTHPEQAEVVRAGPEGSDGGPVCVLAPDGQLRFTAPCAAVLACAGLGTGILSGLFGVGGGFLIVPALMLVTRMGAHHAVGTSLLIISAIGFAGVASAILNGELNWAILLPFTAGGAVAMMGSRLFARRVSGPALQKAFSVLVVLVGISMLIEIVV